MARTKNWFVAALKTPSASASADAGLRVADVAIRGEIGDFGVNDSDFIAAIESFGQVDKIAVALNTRGGAVDYALGIFNYLQNHPAQVEIVVEGVALSAGSIILQAASDGMRKMRGNTVTMMHNPWTYAAGNAAALEQVAAELKIYEAALVKTYIARTGKTEEDIRQLLADETYMTADEALSFGFIDEVLSIEKNGAAAMAYASALGIPAAVAEKIRALESAEDPDLDDADDADDEAREAEARATAEEAARLAAEAAANSLQSQCAAPTLVQQIIDATNSSGMQAFSDLILMEEVENVAQAAAIINRAREVSALCEVAKKPAMARALIRERVTLAEARTRLATLVAAEDEQLETSSLRRLNTKNQPLDTARRAASPVAYWAGKTNPQ